MKMIFGFLISGSFFPRNPLLPQPRVKKRNKTTRWLKRMDKAGLIYS
jgi:hypothetical protein